MADTTETAIYKLRVEGEDQIKSLQRSIADLAATEDKAANSTRTFSQSLQNNLARNDKVIQNNERYRKDLERIHGLQEAGQGTQTQLNAALEAATTRHRATAAAIDEHAKALGTQSNASKLARYEMINLSRQLQDVGVSLFSGQNPLTVFVQQGTQIADISASSGVSITNMFKQAGAAIGTFLINPVTLAITTVTALTATVLGLANAWDKAQKSAEMALTGAGRASGTTIRDLNQFVEKSSGVSGTRLSGGEARELANAMAATGKIVVSQLDDMSDAVVGFAAKTKTSTAEASASMVKFATDPVKGLEELEKVYGAVDVQTREAVKAMSDADNKTGAFNLALRATAEEATKAAKGLTAVEKATRLLFSSREIGFKPTGLEDQVDAARRRVEAAINEPPMRTGVAADDAAFAQRAAEALKELNAEYEKLYAAQQRDLTAQMTLKMNEWAKALGVVEQSILPQIKQIENLTTAIEAMEAAKARGVVGPLGVEVDAQALTIAEGMKQDLIESIAAAARVTEEVNRIAEAHKGVSRAIALQLDDLERQTALAGAVGAAERMAAQAAIDYAAAKRQGATDAEAGLIAAEKQKATQAAINASARETLFDLQNQAAAAAAVTGAEQIAAQAAATYNKMVHDGVDASIAAAVAAQQKANAEAQATANVLRQVKGLEQQAALIQAATQDIQQAGTGFVRNTNQAAAAAAIAFQNARDSGADSSAAQKAAAATLAQYAEQEAQARAQATASVLKQTESMQDQTEMVYAQMKGTEATTAAAIAYKNAIQAGASATAAAALSAATMENYFAKSVADLAKMVNGASTIAAMMSQGSFTAGADRALQMAPMNAPQSNAFSANPMNFSPTVMTGKYSFDYNPQTTRMSADAAAFIPASVKMAAAQAIADQQVAAEKARQEAQDKVTAQIVSTNTAGGLIDVYEKAAAKAIAERDTGAQLSAYQAELGYVRGLPPSTENYQKIASLQDAIENLTKSTDSLNATNQELLSPYYTMDPRTSHIGFRSQGMAAGGYVDVPGGVSANDNMMAMIPVASGERIYVDPMTGRRSGGGSGGVTINISSPITINGNANKDEFGRTLYQANQQLARQIRAATQ